MPKQNNMTYTAMKNAAGNRGQTSTETFKAAAPALNGANTSYQILTNEPGKDAWPNSRGYLRAASIPSRSNTSQGMRPLSSSTGRSKCDQAAQELDYISLPESVESEIRAAMARESKRRCGKPVVQVVRLETAANNQENPTS